MKIGCNYKSLVNVISGSFPRRLFLCGRMRFVLLVVTAFLQVTAFRFRNCVKVVKVRRVWFNRVLELMR